VSDGIRITLLNDDMVQRFFSDLPDDVMRGMLTKLRWLAVELQEEVLYKLSGPVLNIRSGRLFDSVQQRAGMVDGKPQAIVEAGEGVIYAKIHEYGGWIYGGLSEASGSLPNGAVRGGRRALNMPERSYMRSTLQDMRGYVESSLREHFLRTMAAHFNNLFKGFP
jgi:phage gpG-like protein